MPNYTQCIAHSFLHSLSIRWKSQWALTSLSKVFKMSSFIFFSVFCFLFFNFPNKAVRKWINENEVCSSIKRSIPKEVLMFQWMKNWKQKTSYYWQRCWMFYCQFYSLDLSQIGCQRLKRFLFSIEISSAETDNSWSINYE